MNRTLLSVVVVGVLALALLVSCNLTGMTEADFAVALMKTTANSTGAYTPPGKGVVYDENGLKIEVTETSTQWPEDGTYPAVVTFTAYNPPFSQNSTVDGTINSIIIVDTSVSKTVTMSFAGELTVTGAHAGVYEFDAVLVFHLDTGEYEYSGTVTIDGTLYNL